MHVRLFLIATVVALLGGAPFVWAVDDVFSGFDRVAGERPLCPLVVKKAPPADLPSIDFPEELQLHDKNPTTSSRWMAFRKIKLSPRGTEGYDRAVNSFVVMDTLHGKAVVDNKGLVEAANQWLKSDRFATPVTWVDGKEAQLLSTQRKVIFPTFTTKASGEMSYYGLEYGTQRLFILDLPSGEATQLYKIDKTTGSAPAVDLLHDERYLKIHRHFHKGEETVFTFAETKTGKLLRISAPPNQDLIVSGDGGKVLSAFVREDETPDAMNRVVKIGKAWEEAGFEDATVYPLGKVGRGISFQGKVWSSTQSLDRHVVNLNLSPKPGEIPRLKWVDLSTGEAVQKNLTGWKEIQDQLGTLRKKGMRLDASRWGKATFSADGRYMLVQLNLHYSAVEGHLPENFVWSGVWDLEGKGGPKILTSENMKALHEADIGPRPGRHEFFHDAATETHLTANGTFIAVRAEPREVGGGMAQIRVLVMRVSPDGKTETRAYMTEALDLDAVHQHGSTNTGVHSLKISPDGKTVSFEPTGNGSRVVKIVW